MAESLNCLAKMIEHALLHPAMNDSELADGCRLAIRHGLAAVCIKPYAVSMAAKLLEGSGVKVCAVVGFPHGNSRSDVKLAEAIRAIEEGAAELDMVVNIGKVLSKDWQYVQDEIKTINDACVQRGAILKVIFENDYLPDDAYKIRLCDICSQINVAFVKTSTGYGFVRRPDGSYRCSGATDHDLILMRRHCAPQIRIKAAGGLRTLDDLLRVHSLGASRIGTSATEAILAEAIRRGYA